MIYEKEFVQGFKQDDYQPPRTIRTRVQTEGSFCASGDEVNVDVDDQKIEVEEYQEIGNEISFD